MIHVCAHTLVATSQRSCSDGGFWLRVNAAKKCLCARRYHDGRKLYENSPHPSFLHLLPLALLPAAWAQSRHATSRSQPTAAASPADTQNLGGGSPSGMGDPDLSRAAHSPGSSSNITCTDGQVSPQKISGFWSFDLCDLGLCFPSFLSEISFSLTILLVLNQQETQIQRLHFQLESETKLK